MRKDYLWLSLIILTGFALRMFMLGEQSLWYDEGVTWMLSQMKLPALVQWTADDIQPPLYYLLLWATDIILDDSEWALRLPSVIFSILTIPLIYIVARKLCFRSPVPLFAAAILALSPLMVYYSQEARMYTLLVFETTLSSYLLLKILHSNRLPASRVIPLLYSFTTAAALYTHYFAAFLLIAHAIYALIILWQRQFPKALGIRLLWSFGGTLLLFTPWISILLARLGDDPSYWPGALKLSEAIRKVLISFIAGETVLEQTGWWLTIGYLTILLLCGLLAVARQHANTSTSQTAAQEPSAGHSLLFLLLWLLLPVTLILVLSTQSPKFNPRYMLISWPAFALILASIFGQPFSIRRKDHKLHAPFYILRFIHNTLRIALVILTVAIFAFSLVNWFTNRRFSKDNFKATAQFVQERKGNNETVLLSSGHLFPVWAYYSGWENWTPLPWMLRLDVNQVTDISIAEQIAAAVEEKEGVWLVTWQDHIIDPTGVVPFWLDLIGERPHDAGDFWGVGLEHWRLKPDKISLLNKSPVNHQLDYNFNNQINLIGMTQLNNNKMILFWEPRRALPDNLVLTLGLSDPDGFNWSRETTTAQPGSPFYPPSRWPAGQTIITRHPLPWQTGSPPGLYVAEIGLGTTEEQGTDLTGWDILDEQQRPQRRTALVNFVNLSHLVEPEKGPLPQDQSPLVDFFPIIGLRRSILPEDTAQPGDTVLLALLWQAGQYNFDDISVAFDLVDAGGQTHRVGSSLTPSRNFNLPRWQSGDTVLGQYRLTIPPQSAPGPATLQVHLINVSYPYDEIFSIDELEILPTERNFTPPATVDIPLGSGDGANFSGKTTLLGVDCANSCRANPGQSINLILYWQAELPLEANYTIFTHLIDAEETVLINADHAPPKPAQGWVPGEIITDPVTLNIPQELLPGDYSIEIGLYNAADPAFTRLPLSNGETRVILPESLTIE